MISNNIANTLTPGYKVSKPFFNNMLMEKIQMKGIDAEHPYIPDIGFIDSYIDFSDASLVETGNKFDLGIMGDGFFVISTQEGEMYTRNGQFSINSDQKLVTLDGNPVMGEGGEITINGLDVRVENDGAVYSDDALVDIIKIVSFKDKMDLRNYGKALFINTGDRDNEIVPEDFSVKQGFYEASNVNVMKEMVELISSLRAYESYTKVDQFFSDILTKLINIGRY